jgi:proteasome lid subunit RPN8/RPN11
MVGDIDRNPHQMSADSSAKERPIGFYHSGPRLRSSDLEITELFKRFCPRPVMVIVDVRASGGRGDTGIPTDAYFPVEEIRDVRVTRSFTTQLIF